MDKKVIFKTKFGSHLYGTNTPNSDLDYKGIFMESLDNIVLNRASKTMFENVENKNESGRNTNEAVDCEWIELRKFIDDCIGGQTYALDMLFSGSNKELGIEIANDIWFDIVRNRDKLLSKDVKPYIGYCRQQATKYGLKGSRLGELIRLLEWLKTLPPQSQLIEHIDLFVQSEFVWREQKEILVGGKPLKQDFLVVLEKRFPINLIVKRMIESLDSIFAKYGSRAKEAEQNNGIDWKAISHAFRCMFQLKELAQTGQIVFPLKDAEFLKEVKMGKIDWKICNEQLYELMEETIKDVEFSNMLPDKVDREFWDKWIINKYL